MLATTPEGSEKAEKGLRVHIRFDFKGEKSGRLFGGKSTSKMAEENRDHKAALLRNVPMRGVVIEEIDTSSEAYTVLDEETGREIAYAPLEMTATADSIEDVLSFVMRPEFRRIQIIHPEETVLSNKDLERLLYKVNEELNNFTQALEKKLNGR